MLLVSKELNGTVKGIHKKFHRLEDLINGYRGVNASNFDEVNTLISSISRDVLEMSQRINRLGYADQAKLFVNVNEFRPEYYRYS